MRNRGLTILLASVALSGCTGRYVELYLVPAPSPSATVQGRITATMAEIHKRGVEFAKKYISVSKEADKAQLPLVGLAVATAAVAVEKPAHAADAISDLAIGAGAYTTVHSIVAPTKGPESFRSAVDAINCVLIEGNTFLADGIPGKVDTLSKSTDALDTSAALLAAAVTIDVVIPDEATKKQVELARANAKLAIARATSASQAARTQLGAWNSAPDEFDRATATIISTLAAKTSVRTVIDVSALAASWTKPPKAEGGQQAEGLGGINATNLIARLTDSTSGIDKLTAQVTAQTANFNFADHLKKLVACPAKV